MARFLGLGAFLLVLLATCANSVESATTQNPTSISLTPTAGSTQDASTEANTSTASNPTSSDSPNTTNSPTSTKGGPPVKCQFNFMKNDSTIPAYVHVTNEHADKEHTYEIIETSKNFLVFRETFKGNKSFIQAELLKPCTNYTVKVIGCSPIEGSPISFISSGEVTATSYNVTSINDTDVCFEVEFSGFKGKVIQCIERAPENSCILKEKTIQLDTCNCTMNFTMPPVTPYITFNQAVPSQFKWTNKNAKCDNKSMAIVCNSKITYNVDEDVSLLPLTQYTCTGKYTYHRHHTIESNTLLINITCMFAAPVFENTTHNSTIMSWNSSLGADCSGIKFDRYSASCKDYDIHVTGNCKQSENPTKCSFDGLIPYTDYNCDITATDPILNYTHKIKGDFETTSYYPNFTSKIDVHYSSHNSFNATCNEPNSWNGIKLGYIANISIDGKIENTSKVEKKCHFVFKDLYYLTKYTITIRAINTNRKETAITETTDTKYNDKAVIGFLAFLIIVTSVALLFVLYKIYLLRRKQSRNSEEDGILLASPLISVEPISADGLVEAYKSKIADEGRLFLAEFQSIPRIFSNYTIKEAKKAENQSKNRYVDILPYDYNRVTLSSGAEHDYINASFIEGYKEPKKYIAAQGPKDETIDDFWRMIWEQQSSIIVMVTRCEEGNKSKCAQYWPSLDRETEIFDDFIVKIKTEENCPEYIIRHLVLTNKREKGAEREVTHIQFISWPDHGVPGDPSLLLKLRRRVNSFKNFFSGPVVVHCSAGVGRTGTYIGIDAMIESLEAEGQVDIYGYVAKLRRQRCLMVQVEAQYILIHTALIEHNQFGETEMSLPEFHSVLNTLRQKDGTDPSLLEMEFQKLPKFKNWRTFNTAANEENKKKNRCSSVVPYDYNRVIFRLDVECNQITDPDDEDYSSDEEEEESNEYINASFIEGYWCSKSLIAAQGPLQNTMAEFLLMLYQQQTKTVVMLSDCTENDKEHCSQYWGDEKKVFGEMEIEVKKTESFPTYVRRQLEIQSTKKKEVLEVNQYQFLKWRNCDLPENPHELIEMMRHIKENGGYDNSKMNRNIPIVVHCIDGSSRTGIFCALWNLMDSASTEKLVDVFQVVKNLRKERRGICETVEQYQFLYSALEGAFPVQNGGVKTPASNDSVQIVNEKTALLSDPESTTGADQKEAETSQAKESSAQEAPAASEEAAAASENPTASSPPEEGASESEKPSTEGTTNGPSVSVEA